MHVLVAGAGWLGTALARALVARGDRVTGVRRDVARAALLREAGAVALVLDLAEPGAEDRIPADVEAVVACQAADGEGVPAYRRAYLDANRTLLEAARRLRVRTFVYTGSSGVFGQRDGSEVDEGSAPLPASPGNQVLAEAESLVLDAHGVRASVLRLSGLYGPGRMWPVDRVRSGRLALGPGDDTWMNFCHLRDAVSAIAAVLDRGEAGRVYHASDAQPARRREVVEWVAARLGIPAPRIPVGSAPASLPSRRVRAERTRRELGLSLLYPSFREGVEAELSRPGEAER